MYTVFQEPLLNLGIKFCLTLFQYYRKARQMALHAVFPEFDMDEDENGSGVGRLSYPRPISEPPSPTSSRATTPIPSDQSDEDDEVDEEREVFFDC
jgi:glycogen(starch) synthase